MLNNLVAFYSQNALVFNCSVFVLGLFVGSFLNVVIYRLPIMLEREWQAQASEALAISSAQTATTAARDPQPFTLSVPRSACPVCKAPITAAQNVPVVSWLLLKGRCAACKVRISARYPVVELATGLLSAWAAWRFGFGVSTAYALLMTWALIALTGIDIDHQLLPDSITLPLLWIGLLAAVITGSRPGESIPVSASDAVIGAMVGYLSLWAIFHAFRLATGKEGMGYGDFKLFAALGAWLGWKILPLLILLSAGTGAVLGVSMIVIRGRDRTAPMPFGPYLATAGWLGMMYGDSLITAYLTLSGLRR